MFGRPLRGHHHSVTPELSIVITNHNYAEFLADAIRSALGQRNVGVEVVVVDDGSTDDSRRVIQQYADRVTAVFTPNNGQGAAFNRGFAASSGDAVIFLDADDVLSEDTAERVVTAMRDDTTTVRVQFVLDVIDRDGHATGATVPDSPKVPFEGDARAMLLTCPDDIVWQPTSGNAFRRTALDSILPMPEEPFRICADYYLSNLVPLHGNVRVLDGAGGSYRVHGANTHFSTDERPDRLRANVARTQETHRYLIDETRRLGLTGLPSDPAAVGSVSSVANRLLSYRLAPDDHPVRDDSLPRLLRLGVSSSIKRIDVSPMRRAMFAAWFVVASLAPTRFVRRVARPFASIR
jgi:GT2 family glycosyltransferase